MASATQMIRRDHKKVEGLFEKFDQAKKAEAKKKICEQVIEELEVHAKLEEEIFYPAVRKHIGEEDMLDEAKQEHQEAKQIMARLKSIDADEDEFEETFSELVDAIKHHVEEEEGEMLPKADESEMDLDGYGEEMAQRKKELLGQASKASKKQSAKKTGGRKPKSGSARRRSGRAA
jgi:hypothetical protein